MSKLVNPNAGGIDISSKEHYVAVPEGRSKECVRTFQSFTEDLHLLAQWLKSCGVETVAMESTGVYWYHLYTVLLDYGFEVLLVNAHHVKNVPGRKSDVSDARWLQELHSFGLLRGCFQPDNLTRALRNYVRQRKSLIRQMSAETQRMQKALEQMNIKLNNVIRDIHGKTGTMIIKSILGGERDPEMLARHRDYRIKAPRELLIKSLRGNWREEQLFNLQMAYDHYLFLQGQLEKCDVESERVIAGMEGEGRHGAELTRDRKQKNQPNFDVKGHLYSALGTDVTEIHGMKASTALTVFSETGANLKEKFPTDKQFLSWLNVVPDNKITGGKVVYSRVKRKKNNAGQAFRDAANALWKAKNPLGDYLRRKKAKSGGRQAVVATARRIASIYYKMVTEKVVFDAEFLETDRQTYLQNKIVYLEKMATRLKHQLSENQDIKESVI